MYYLRYSRCKFINVRPGLPWHTASSFVMFACKSYWLCKIAHRFIVSFHANPVRLSCDERHNHYGKSRKRQSGIPKNTKDQQLEFFKCSNLP